MSFETSFVIAVLTLLGNAFFVGAEFGLISARRSSIEPRALEGSRAAKTTLVAMEEVSLMLAGAQLGVTLCSLVLGAVAEPLFAHLLEYPFELMHIPELFIHPLAFVIALLLTVYLHVVIGEMVPKNLALANPDRTALLLTPPLAYIVRAINPIVTFLNFIANSCLRLAGIKPRREVSSSFTRDEVAGFVEESRQEGLLSEIERELLSGALHFDERTVLSVVLPLEKIATVPKNVTPEEIEDLAASTGYSRFPVRVSGRKLAGYIHLKDILGVEQKNQRKPIPARDIRPLAIVSSSSTLRSVLTQLRTSGTHLAQVVNGRGVLLGIVALEDVLEELVGEIRDDTQAELQQLTTDKLK